MTVRTAGCGDANPGIGSGVAVEDRLILTAAHVVAGSSEVEVASGPATIVAYDPDLDLALLEVGPDPSRPELEPPPLEVLDVGERGTIVGGAASGDVDFVVTERTIVETDEVRGTGRVRRRAYVLAATTEPGDSGAGLFDAEGRLVGLLFAASADEDGRSWATAGDEIDRFLAGADRSARYHCNPRLSRLEAVGGATEGG